ncbi:MAG: hypothetical protein SGI77_10340 [Pirellulaceae bacterium]|nr:hypothetical protein [Pirellulaceae bacterium]
MTNKSKTVSVRLAIDLIDLVEERAAIDGLSSGIWLRKLVENEIFRPFNAAHFEQLIGRLNANQAKSLYYVLTQVGSMDSETAAELVRSKLLGD